MRLEGKVIIVTGAGTGIGASLVRGLARRTARIVLVGRRKEKLDRVVSALPAGTHAVVCAADVSRIDDLERVKETTLEHFGVVDALINNAGVAYGGALSEVQPEELDYMLRVNLLAPMLFTRLLLPLLHARPEALIVNVSSMSGLVPMPFQAGYTASKFGLRGFSEALRRELGSSRVRVLEVFPGGTDTEMITEDMRDVALTVDAYVPELLPADSVAQMILRAVERDKNAVIASPGRERFAALLQRALPSLIDRMLISTGPKLERIMRAANAWTRARNPLPPAQS
jgi:short-subunit dehydrogenase